MDVQYYNQMSMAARNNEPYIVPEEFMTEGEWDVDKTLSILEAFGYITQEPFELKAKLKLDYPEVYELLYTILRDQRQANLDKLVEDKVIDMCMSDTGEIKYTWTKDGAEYCNDLLDKG